MSQNLYASTLPLLVAAKHGERTLADGFRRQGLYLRLVGVDAGGFSFGGGAGGKEADATTPRATVQLLTGLKKRPEWDAMEVGLPIMGVDGTLFGMVPANSPVYGKVHAKTGTLWWEDLDQRAIVLRSKALAGTMTTAKGSKLIFAMFVNDVPLPPGVLPTREGMLLGDLNIYCGQLTQDLRLNAEKDVDRSAFIREISDFRPMIRYRTFRNDDPPALTAIWNAAGLGRGAATPISPGLFDRDILAKPYFDPAGLIVAEDNETPIGFAHAGFGPNEDETEIDQRRRRSVRRLGAAGISAAKASAASCFGGPSSTCERKCDDAT